jgi:hypothetical protein
VLFTKFVELGDKEKFQWGRLSEYKLLVFASFSSWLDEIDEDTFDAFAGRAEAYTDILFVFAKNKDGNNKILAQFELLGKYVKDLDTGRPYFLVLKSSDILDVGHEFINAEIIYLDEYLDDILGEDDQGLSQADRALLNSFAELNQDLKHHKARTSKGKLVKLLKFLVELLLA